MCGRGGLKRDPNAVLCRPFSRPDRHGRGGGLEVAVPLIVTWWRAAYAHARMAYDNERENRSDKRKIRVVVPSSKPRAVYLKT